MRKVEGLGCVRRTFWELSLEDATLGDSMRSHWICYNKEKKTLLLFMQKTAQSTEFLTGRCDDGFDH